LICSPLRNVDENSKKKPQAEEESKEALKTTEVCCCGKSPTQISLGNENTTQLI
jgi:hypothetical protein